jgi:hypothetical protein
MNESKNGDMDSCVSGFSMVSVGGEEVSCEKALDDSCKDIQSAVNEIHIIARQLLMADERDDTYEEMNPLYEQLAGLIKEGCVLLKDLGKICKQIIPKPPRAAQKAKKESVLDSCGAR